MDECAEKLLRWDDEDEAQILQHVADHGCSNWQTAAETLKCSSGLCAARWCCIVAAVQKGSDAASDAKKRQVSAWSKAELAVVLGVYLHATASPNIKQAKAFIAAAASKVLPHRSAHAVHLVLNRVLLPNQAKLQVNFRTSGLSSDVGELLDAWLEDPAAQMPDNEARQLASQLLAAEGAAAVPPAAVVPHDPASQSPPESQSAPPAATAAGATAANSFVPLHSAPTQLPTTTAAAAAAAAAMLSLPEVAGPSQFSQPLQSGMNGLLEAFHSTNIPHLQEPDYSASGTLAAAAAAADVADTTSTIHRSRPQQSGRPGKGKWRNVSHQQQELDLQFSQSAARNELQVFTALQPSLCVPQHVEQSPLPIAAGAAAAAAAASRSATSSHLQQGLQERSTEVEGMAEWALQQLAQHDWSLLSTLPAPLTTAASSTSKTQQLFASSGTAADRCKAHPEQALWPGMGEAFPCSDVPQLSPSCVTQSQQLAAGGVRHVPPTLCYTPGGLAAGAAASGATQQQGTGVLQAACCADSSAAPPSAAEGASTAGAMHQLPAAAQQQLLRAVAAVDSESGGVSGWISQQPGVRQNQMVPCRADAKEAAAAQTRLQLQQQPQEGVGQLLPQAQTTMPNFAAQYQQQQGWLQQLQRHNSNTGSAPGGQPMARTGAPHKVFRHGQYHEHPAAGESAHEPGPKRLLTANMHHHHSCTPAVTGNTAAVLAGGVAAAELRQPQQQQQQHLWHQQQQQQVPAPEAVPDAAGAAAAVVDGDGLNMPAHVQDLQEIQQALKVMQHCFARIAATSRQSRHTSQLQEKAQLQQQQQKELQARFLRVPDISHTLSLPASVLQQSHTAGNHQLLQQQQWQQLQDWQLQMSARTIQQYQQSDMSGRSSSSAAGTGTAVDIGRHRRQQAAGMLLKSNRTCKQAAYVPSAVDGYSTGTTVPSLQEQQQDAHTSYSNDVVLATSWGRPGSACTLTSNSSSQPSQRGVAMAPQAVSFSQYQDQQALQHIQQQLQSCQHQTNADRQMQCPALPLAAALTTNLEVAAVAPHATAGFVASVPVAGSVTNHVSACGSGTSTGSGSAQQSASASVGDHELLTGTTTAADATALLQTNVTRQSAPLCNPTTHRAAARSHPGSGLFVQGSTAAAAAALNEFALELMGNDAWEQLSSLFGDAE